jgi:hypothetical protein
MRQAGQLAGYKNDWIFVMMAMGEPRPAGESLVNLKAERHENYATPVSHGHCLGLIFRSGAWRRLPPDTGSGPYLQQKSNEYHGGKNHETDQNIQLRR